jgi:hypothetical protein
MFTWHVYSFVLQLVACTCNMTPTLAGARCLLAFQLLQTPEKRTTQHNMRACRVRTVPAELCTVTTATT